MEFNLAGKSAFAAGGRRTRHKGSGTARADVIAVLRPEGEGRISGRLFESPGEGSPTGRAGSSGPARPGSGDSRGGHTGVEAKGSAMRYLMAQSVRDHILDVPANTAVRPV